MCSNVILVEAEKDSLLSIGLILKLNGFKVIVCKNLDKAWYFISVMEKESSLNVILITDIPFVRLVKEDIRGKRNHHKAVPVYVIDDYVDGKTLWEMAGYYLIEKPVEPEEFLNRISKNIQIKKKGEYHEKN